MKTKKMVKCKKSASRQFQEDITNLLARTYSRQLSESIERGIRAKKERGYVKHCKV